MATFGYWYVRGGGQPIRFLLAYLNINHNNKIYSTGDDWFVQDKFSLGLEFPNIPYFIDGDVKLTESAAIPVYLIKKCNRPELLGQNANGSFSYSEVRVQQLLGFFRDLNKELMTTLCSNPEFNTIKDKLLVDKLQPMLDRVVNVLGNQQFLVGHLTYADFVFYEILNYYKYIFPQTINETLSSYMNRFENLPGIKQYLSNPDINLKEFLPAQYCAWSGPQQL